MKKINIAIIVIIGIHVIIYGIFSFIMWEFNPAHWGETPRVLCSFISFGLSSIFGVSIILNNIKL